MRRASILALLATMLLPLVAGAWQKGGLRVRGRLMTRWELVDQSTQEDDLSGWTNAVGIPHARLDLRWKSGELLRLVLELEFADGFQSIGDNDTSGWVVEDMLKDCYGEVRLAPEFRVRAGQFKKPFSRLRLESPWRLLVPERGLLNDYFVNQLHLGDLAGSGAAQHAGGYGGRDLGVMLHGRLERLLDLGYAVGYFNAPGFFAGHESSHRDIVARLEFKPLQALNLGLDATAKNFSEKQSRQQLWVSMLGLDAELKLADLTLQLEAVFGDNPVLYSRLPAGGGDYHLGGGKVWGGHALVAYRVRLSDDMELTPAVMVEALEPSTSVSGEGLRLAGALNLDFAPGARLILFAEAMFGDPKTAAYQLGAQTPEAERLYSPTRIGLQLELSL